MIEVTDLSFKYGQKTLFEGLNASFSGGGIYGVLGKNGAGKTSLFKLVCGLLKPGSGSCQVLGNDSFSRHPSMLMDLFFIPESYYLPPVSIRQYQKLHAPLYRLFDDEYFDRYLEELELDGSQMLNTLSYGLTKRFLLAFGLASNCRILLLDEPTNGLDIPSKRIFRKLLANTISRDRLFIIATHQIKELENIFDHLFFIDQGRMLLSCALDEVANSLSFRTVLSRDELEEPLYLEESPGGYAAIELNRTGQENLVDIEFLFNAVMEEPERIASAIQHFKEVGYGK